MKKTIVLLMAALFVCGACSLKEEPTSFVNKKTFYENREQCVAALNSCYIPLNSIFTANFMLVVEACSDIWYSTSSTVDAALDVSPSKPQFGQTVWTQAYKGVMYCNEAIHCIANTKLADEVKNPLVAEGRVMRAFYYYLLTCMFNGVPYYTSMVDSYAVQDSIRALPRTDASVIRQRLYDDLQYNALPYFTEENGLKARSSDVPDNRSGYAMALMLMAKFALWNEQWDEALVPLLALEELYGDLTEANYPLEQIMWRYDNVPESIFEIQHAWSRTGTKYYGNVACIMMPTHNGGGVFDGVALSGYGDTMPGWASLRSNNKFAIFRPAQGTTMAENTAYDSVFGALPLTYDTYDATLGRYRVKVDPEAAAAGVIRGKKIDRRATIALGMGNFETGGTFKQTSTYGICWPGPKFWCPDIQTSYDGNNYKIFRYADAVLMLAECYCNLQNAEACMEYLNKVRARAGLDPITSFTGYEDLMVEIRSERARELCGEFMRKFDLVRWGIWYEQTYALTQNRNLKERILPCHRYYPIPDRQCSLSGYALDNPEYKASGLN